MTPEQKADRLVSQWHMSRAPDKSVELRRLIAQEFRAADAALRDAAVALDFVSDDIVAAGTVLRGDTLAKVAQARESIEALLGDKG